MKRFLSIFTLILLIICKPCFAIQQAFYVLRGDGTGDAVAEMNWLNTLKQHSKSVNLILSQAYQIDDHGTLWDTVNLPLYNFAMKNNIKFMALVTNQDFDSDEVDRFLRNPAAVNKVVNELLLMCEKRKLYGIQVDFEHVQIQDRTQFTTFYQQLSQTLHQHGYKISAALYPVTTNTPNTTILKRIYNGWVGAYDFATIGKDSDFVTIMTYNQNAGTTTPGPTAGVPWVKKVITYTLKYIPANKISLGIPVYSNYWHMVLVNNEETEALGTGVSYASAQAILTENNQTLKWDNTEKVPYTFYFKNQFGEYIFAENAQSFEAKLNLVKQYHLQGFSVWRLGLEDPAIWKVLAKTDKS